MVKGCTFGGTIGEPELNMASRTVIEKKMPSRFGERALFLLFENCGDGTTDNCTDCAKGERNTICKVIVPQCFHHVG